MKRAESLTQGILFAAGLLLVAITLSAALPGTATAADGDEWQFGANLYLWYADLGGGTVNGADIDVGADALIDKLELGLMGGVNARRGKWGGLLDAIYLKVGDSRSITAPSVPLGVGANLDVQTWILTPAVTYRVFEQDGASIDVLAGARYLWMDADLDFDFIAPTPRTIRDFSKSGDFWDAIVGVRGDLALTENWVVPFHLDIGTGQTDFTWQAMGGIGYRFSTVDVVVAYRYLSWDFEDGAEIFDDLNISGPLAGVRFRF